MRKIKNSAIYTESEAIELAKKIKWLNNADYRYVIHLMSGVDSEPLVAILWEEEEYEEAECGELN